MAVSLRAGGEVVTGQWWEAGGRAEAADVASHQAELDGKHVFDGAAPTLLGLQGVLRLNQNNFLRPSLKHR